MIKTISIIVLGFLFLTSPVYATEAPTLISPVNNSTVTTSKLEWQSPSYPIYTQGSPYVVQIKNIPNFTSQDDRYKTNTYYTPKLSAGTWYWRVKAKNSDRVWSDWSETWSFNLVNTISTPTATPAPTSTASPTPSSSTFSFTISDLPSQINSDQSFTISVNLSLSNNPNTNFYLKGAFKKSDSSNYFGQTKVSGNWIKNSSTYTNQYKITTDSSGNWSGNLEVKPDAEDSGFIGSDDYIFKVGRYKDSDNSSVIWSNEFTLEITQVALSNDTDGTESTPQPLTNSTNNLIVQEKSVLSKATSAPKVNYPIATVAAVNSSATPSSQLAVKNQKQINTAVWIGLILVFAGASSLGYIYLKRK